MGGTATGGAAKAAAASGTGAVLATAMLVAGGVVGLPAGIVYLASLPAAPEATPSAAPAQPVPQQAVPQAQASPPQFRPGAPGNPQHPGTAVPPRDTPVSIPEPASLGLLAVGLAVLVLAKRIRARRAG